MTDHPELATTRRHLGELGVMAAQTERAERQILARAEHMLDDVLAKLDEKRPLALRGDAEAREYQGLVAERGRLERVIAQARKVLAD